VIQRKSKVIHGPAIIKPETNKDDRKIKPRRSAALSCQRGCHLLLRYAGNPLQQTQAERLEGIHPGDSEEGILRR
jgi:hypothetical protein